MPKTIGRSEPDEPSCIERQSALDMCLETALQHLAAARQAPCKQARSTGMLEDEPACNS